MLEVILRQRNDEVKTTDGPMLSGPLIPVEAHKPRRGGTVRASNFRTVDRDEMKIVATGDCGLRVMN